MTAAERPSTSPYLLPAAGAVRSGRNMSITCYIGRVWQWGLQPRSEAHDMLSEREKRGA